MGLSIDGDVALLHGLKERRLGLGRGPIDLVGQEKGGEDGASHQGEIPSLEIKDVGARDVSRHEVGRELDAGEVQFETMLATHPSVMRDLLSAMSNQMQEMLNIIAGIRRGSALPRVAGLLVSLAGTDPAHNSVAITQSELAELLGLTRATVKSALGELQSWGALERSYGAIRIIDRGALEDASLE